MSWSDPTLVYSSSLNSGSHPCPSPAPVPHIVLRFSLSNPNIVKHFQMQVHIQIALLLPLKLETSLPVTLEKDPARHKEQSASDSSFASAQQITEFDTAIPWCNLTTVNSSLARTHTSKQILVQGMFQQFWNMFMLMCLKVRIRAFGLICASIRNFINKHLGRVLPAVP